MSYLGSSPKEIPLRAHLSIPTPLAFWEKDRVSCFFYISFCISIYLLAVLGLHCCECFSHSDCCFSVAKLYLTLCDPHRLQHARLPCPSLSPRVCSSSCPLSRWWYLTISSSATLFSSCHQSIPASGSLPVSQLFASGGHSIGALAAVLPVNIQSWFTLGLTHLISLKFYIKHIYI